MKRLLILLLILISPSVVAGQQRAQQQDRAQYVALPRDQVMMVTANQPDCPLKIEEATFLLRVDKPGVIQRYRVRNVSSKPIKYFSIVSWAIGGSGGTLPVYDLPRSGRVLLPGETFDPTDNSPGYDIVPLTEEIRRRLKRERGVVPEGEMKHLYILMVDHIYFTDDTSYKDERASKALNAYLSKFDVID